jgi:hypothetical protein
MWNPYIRHNMQLRYEKWERFRLVDKKTLSKILCASLESYLKGKKHIFKKQKVGK